MKLTNLTRSILLGLCLSPMARSDPQGVRGMRPEESRGFKAGHPCEDVLAGTGEQVTPEQIDFCEQCQPPRNDLEPGMAQECNKLDGFYDLIEHARKVGSDEVSEDGLYGEDFPEDDDGEEILEVEDLPEDPEVDCERGNKAVACSVALRIISKNPCDDPSTCSESVMVLGQMDSACFQCLLEDDLEMVCKLLESADDWSMVNFPPAAAGACGVEQEHRMLWSGGFQSHMTKLFQHSNYGGSAVNVNCPVQYYNYYGYLGIRNFNSFGISSLITSGSWWTWLYKGTYYGGSSRKLHPSDSEKYVGSSWNDQIKSLKWKRFTEGFVLYEHSWWEGKYKWGRCANPTGSCYSYSVSGYPYSLTGVGSSISLAPCWKLTMYSQEGLTGDVKVLQGETHWSNLSSFNWNDKMRSWRLDYTC